MHKFVQVFRNSSCTMNDFAKAFVKGAKETPRGYFAPAVAVWRVLFSVTESLVSKDKAGAMSSRDHRVERHS